LLICYSNHQPLHAIIILLQALIAFPYMPSALETARVIDITFGLHKEQHGLVSGGNHASTNLSRPLTEGGSETWAYLLKMRARAWRAIGLDPDIVWTRAEAVAVIHADIERQDFSCYNAQPETSDIVDILPRRETPTATNSDANTPRADGSIPQPRQGDLYDSEGDVRMADFAAALAEATWAVGDDWPLYLEDFGFMPD
jgi:hypothetical protein